MLMGKVLLTQFTFFSVAFHSVLGWYQHFSWIQEKSSNIFLTVLIFWRLFKDALEKYFFFEWLNNDS